MSPKMQSNFAPVALTFERLSRFDRPAEPCSVGVPFPEGAFGAGAQVAVFDGDRPVPTQSRVTATWPDGSTKWLLVHFLADLPGNAGKEFELRPGKAPIPAEPVEVSGEGGPAVVATGRLEVALGAPGAPGLFSRMALGDFVLAGDGLSGPAVTDGSGEVFTVAVGDGGWEVIEPGPVRAVVGTCGKHRSPAGSEWLDYEARVYAYAGAPWVRLDYRIVNREAEPEISLGAMGFRIDPDCAEPSQVRTALATSNYTSRIRRGEAGEEHEFLIDAEFLVYDANEQLPEVNYGTFWADWTAPGRGGVCITLHQAFQNFPKRLAVSGAGLEAELLPKGSDELRLIQGMAKTHRAFIHLHGPTETAEDVNVRSLQFQMPDRPALPPEVFIRSGVTEDVFVEKPVRRVERYLVDLADRRTRGYGILNWGDGPDMNYTEQGRGRGELVWTNNEYDLPHAAMLAYARSGERKLLDYMLVAAEHWMDVDVCHHSDDPMRRGGQIVHSARHATSGVTPSHEWVEGLLDYWHVTGERLAYDVALGIGENVLRQLEGRPHLRRAAGSAARETGWALRTLVAMYVETHDERWMEPADFIVKQFEAWAAEYGAWLAPYTDHTLARVPFMIAVAANSLMRYWRVRPEKRVGDMIVEAVRDIIEHCQTVDGRFYYKELPSLRQRAAGSLVLEAMAAAYEISGDESFVEAGLEGFELVVGSPPPRGNVVGRKYVAGDAVVWETGPSPKAFGASFLPVMAFYRAATRAGMLE